MRFSIGPFAVCGTKNVWPAVFACVCICMLLLVHACGHVYSCTCTPTHVYAHVHAYVLIVICVDMRLLMCMFCQQIHHLHPSCPRAKLGRDCTAGMLPNTHKAYVG